MPGAVARVFSKFWKIKKTLPITLVLILKADACISSQCIPRLLCFLALLKKKYAKTSIALGVLDANHKSRQLHSALYWNGISCIANKALFDLRDFTQVIQNEVMEKSNVSLWTAACYPVQVLSNNTLPLPLFTEASNAEFCLRLFPEQITLNGLCAWHFESPGARSAYMPYYTMRNSCIVAATRGVPIALPVLKRRIRNALLQHILCLRYSAAELLLDGINDFCLGPSLLQEKSPEETHSHILNKAPKLLPVERQAFRFLQREYKLGRKLPPETWFSRIMRKVTINGLLLPPHKTKILPLTESSVRYFYRVQRVFFYDETTQSGYTARWNLKSIYALIRRWIRVRTMLDACYSNACADYYERRQDLRSSIFWKQYVNVPKE